MDAFQQELGGWLTLFAGPFSWEDFEIFYRDWLPEQGDHVWYWSQERPSPFLEAVRLLADCNTDPTSAYAVLLSVLPELHCLATSRWLQVDLGEYLSLRGRFFRLFCELPRIATVLRLGQMQEFPADALCYFRGSRTDAYTTGGNLLHADAGTGKWEHYQPRYTFWGSSRTQFFTVDHRPVVATATAGFVMPNVAPYHFLSNISVFWDREFRDWRTEGYL